MLSPPAYYSVLFLVSAFAFLRGGSDERIAAATCIAATFATNLVYTPAGSFARVEVELLIVDLATFFAFTFLALRTDRFWPLWIAGLQLTTLVAHGLKAIHLDLMPQAYAAAERFWVYPIFAVIVIGAIRSRRRRATPQTSASSA